MPVAFDLHTPLLFGADPFAVVLGLDLADLLEPMEREPPTRSMRSKVYQLQMNEGECLVIPIGAWGVIGVRILKSRIVLYMPPQLATGFEQRVPERVRGRAFRGDLEGAVTVAYILNLAPGTEAGVELPAVGRISVIAR